MSVNRIIAACWITFLALWLIMAARRKRTAKRSPRWGGQIARSAFFILLFLALRLAFLWPPFNQVCQRCAAVFWNPATRWTGAAMTVFGIAFAAWARVHLGRNWGQPMTLRQGHELVTSGPYKLVRHPIYTGVIAALFGTALAENIVLLIPFAILSGFFVLSALTEEKHMLREFPEVYPQYQRKTKMLIPYAF